MCGRAGMCVLWPSVSLNKVLLGSTGLKKHQSKDYLCRWSLILTSACLILTCLFPKELSETARHTYYKSCFLKLKNFGKEIGLRHWIDGTAVRFVRAPLTMLYGQNLAHTQQQVDFNPISWYQRVNSLILSCCSTPLHKQSALLHINPIPERTLGCGSTDSVIGM